MGVQLQQPVRQTVYLLHFCHRIYQELARKGLCTWRFLQVAASRCLKSTDIAFFPIGDCIFLPIKEVQYIPHSRFFSRLEPSANGLNAHAGIAYIETLALAIVP